MNCLFWLFLLFSCGGNNGSFCCERPVAEPAPVCPPTWNNDCPCDNVSSVREDSVREDSMRRDSRIMPPPRNDFPGYGHGHGETCGCEENA